MKKITILFLLMFIGFFGETFASSDCSLTDNSFVSEKIDSGVDKKTVEKNVNYFIKNINTEINRNDLYKKRIDEILGNIELLEMGTKSERGHGWEEKKQALLYEAQLLNTELQKVCNIKVVPKKVKSEQKNNTTATGSKNINNKTSNTSNSNKLNSSSTIKKITTVKETTKKFSLDKIENEYKYLSIDYTYEDKKIIFFIYDINLKKKSGFYVSGGNLKLGDNFKHKIIPGHKYKYFFYDKSKRKVLKKGSFKAAENSFSLGTIENKYKNFTLNYKNKNEINFEYKYYKDSDYVTFSFTDNDGVINLGENYKYKIIPGKTYFYNIKDNKTNILLKTSSFNANNTPPEKTFDLPKKDGKFIYYNNDSKLKFCQEQGYSKVKSSTRIINKRWYRKRYGRGWHHRRRHISYVSNIYLRSYYNNKWITTYSPNYVGKITCEN